MLSRWGYHRNTVDSLQYKAPLIQLLLRDRLCAERLGRYIRCTSNPLVPKVQASRPPHHYRHTINSNNQWAHQALLPAVPPRRRTTRHISCQLPEGLGRRNPNLRYKLQRLKVHRHAQISPGSTRDRASRNISSRFTRCQWARRLEHQEFLHLRRRTISRNLSLRRYRSTIGFHRLPKREVAEHHRRLPRLPPLRHRDNSILHSHIIRLPMLCREAIT